MPNPHGLTQAQLMKMLVNIRNQFYPWMHILRRVDGSFVVTIHPPQQRQIQIGGRD